MLKGFLIFNIYIYIYIYICFEMFIETHQSDPINVTLWYG